MRPSCPVRRNEGFLSTEVYRFCDASDEGLTNLVEFRLVYEGPLDPQTSKGRVQEKHAIRKYLHPQLKELWEQFPFLKRKIPWAADQTERHGFRWIPLVSETRACWCALDILFLRRDMPGNLVVSGGDIDNRIKTLFDGLKYPSSRQELGNAVPGPGEDPFYCLLEDDKLITELRIRTDRLLKPIPQSGSINDVLLVIHVKTGTVDFDEVFR